MSAAPREVELKLEFDPSGAELIAGRLAAISAGDKPLKQTLTSVYYDTANHDLRRAGLSLRVRRNGGKLTQTIKAGEGSAGLFDRAEWETDIEGARPDLSAAKGTALEPLLESGVLDGLAPVFMTRIERTAYRLESDEWEAVAALDLGEVLAGESRLPVSELEIELVRGEPAELFLLAKGLAETVPLNLCVKAKAERGYELAEGRVNPVDMAARAHLSGDMTAAEGFRTIGRACLRQLIANVAPFLAGDGEGLHQIRVALRRLRAAMSAFRAMVSDPGSERVKNELRWIAGQTGPARDLDVFVTEVLLPLRRQNRKEPGLLRIVRSFERRRAQAFKNAQQAVRSARFRALALDAAEWLENGQWASDSDEAQAQRRNMSVAEHAARELARRRRKLRRETKAATLQELSEAERHALRIDGKKLRYAVEFFADAFPGKKRGRRRKAALSALKNLQDALGGLNDVATREQLASEIALNKEGGGVHEKGERERAFAAGIIFGSQEAHVARLLDAAEASYRKFLKIKPFWG